MTNEEIQSLFNDSSCYGCAGLSMFQMLQLALYRQWLLALDSTADTSVNGLLNEARCFGCASDADIGTMLEVGILSKIEELL